MTMATPAGLTDLVKQLGVKRSKVYLEGEGPLLALNADELARVAPQLFAAWPLSRLRLWNATGSDLAAALARPELLQIEELELFRNKLKDADVKVLFESPHLGKLRRLMLAFCGLSGRSCAILASADPRRFPALRVLDLSANAIGRVGVQALARSQLVEQLTHLDLDANHGGDETVAELLSSPAVRNLERLNLCRNDWGPLTMQAFAKGEHAVRLVEILGPEAPEVENLIARNRRAKQAWVAPDPPPGELTGKTAAAPVKPPIADPARGTALLAMMLSRPDDPETRMVYADWLQEAGDPRGELVALEARLAAAPEDTALDRKVARLRAAQLKAFQQRYKNKSATLELANGFVRRIVGPLKWFTERGAEILSAEPIRELELNPASEAGVRQLSSIAGIERLEWLTLGFASPKLLAAVPEGPLAGVAVGLAGLGAPNGGHVLGEFLSMPELRRVRGLRFWRPPTIEELRALAADPRLAQLERLELFELGGDAITEIVLSSGWELQRLRLDELTPTMIARLRARYGEGLALGGVRAP